MESIGAAPHVAQYQQAPTVAVIRESAATTTAAAAQAEGAACHMHKGDSKKAPDNPRMQISEEEREWANAIKDHFESLPDLDNLSDFLYVQWALIEQGNVEDVIRRAYNIQDVREEYGFPDNYEDAYRVMCESVDQMPKFFLSFSYIPRDESYVLACDVKGLDRKRLASLRHGDELFIRASYCLNQCACPDFASIRQGATALVECDGYDWTLNIDLRLFRLWSDVISSYPIRLNKIKHFNSGMFINLLYSKAKRFFPQHIRDVNEMGVKIQSGHTLDEIFAVPDVETANQRCLSNFSLALKLRYENVKNFTLPKEEECLNR